MGKHKIGSKLKCIVPQVSFLGLKSLALYATTYVMSQTNAVLFYLLMMQQFFAKEKKGWLNSKCGWTETTRELYIKKRMVNTNQCKESKKRGLIF